MSSPDAAHAIITWIHAASQMEHGTRRKLGFLRGVFPLRAGPEIFLTQETPENQALQRERELEKASAALAILCLLTKKAQISGLCNGNGTWHGLAAKHDPPSIIECVERERELRERERAPRVQVHEPREVWGAGT